MSSYFQFTFCVCRQVLEAVQASPQDSEVEASVNEAVSGGGGYFAVEDALQLGGHVKAEGAWLEAASRRGRDEW